MLETKCVGDIMKMLATVLALLVTNIHFLLHKRRVPTSKRCHQHHCYQKAFEKTGTKTCMIQTVCKMEMITSILCLRFQVEPFTTCEHPGMKKLEVSAVKIPGIKVQLSRTQVNKFNLLYFYSDE